MQKFYILFLSLAFTANIFGSNDKPNILWISFEDTGLDLSVYGDHTAKTPHINELSKQSTIYRSAFATSGVCAPSRSAIITGVNPTTLGTMHMRTGNHMIAKPLNIPINNGYDLTDKFVKPYDAVIPNGVKCFTQLLRAEGYYCSNDAKTDYQFSTPLTAWDECKEGAWWRNRKADQPFFSVININITHESNLFTSIKRPLTVSPDKVTLPPYLPATDSLKYMVARHYSNIELLDVKVGEIIAELKKDKLYDNTIIFFFSDHGGPFPREKREVYDSGTRVPLFIKFPHQKTGHNDELVSLIDLAPTVLDLADIKIPKYMEGISLLRKNNRKYITSHGDRFDEWSDRVRAIRTKNYLYIENQVTGKTGYKDVAYRKSIYGMNEFIQLALSKKLPPHQQRWFDVKPQAEFYNVMIDPDQMTNLILESKNQKDILKLKKLMAKHYSKYGDLGTMPESELIEKMWPGGKQPITEKPIISLTSNEYLQVTCPTPSSTIGYYITDGPIDKIDRNLTCYIYSKPIRPENGKVYTFVSERIGFKHSDVVPLESKKGL